MAVLDPPRPAAESLNKPDMVAVLERTHLPHDTHNFLLPVLEAVSNAFHGIEAQREIDERHVGKIQLRFQNLNKLGQFFVSITDNGVGLNEENYRSFKTPFSGHKLKKKGKGFGRFVAFKVFSRVLYSSRDNFMGQDTVRAFKFDITKANEIIPYDAEPDFEGTGLRVEYNRPLAEWQDTIKSLTEESVVEELAGHFLPVFLYGSLPEITVQFDDAAPIALTTKFRTLFVEYASGQFDLNIDGTTSAFSYSFAKLPKSRKYNSHCLLFSAADRIVGKPRDLSTLLGTDHFLDANDEKYVVVAVVRSDVFDAHLNDVRSTIGITPNAVEKISSEIKRLIEALETAQIKKIKDRQQVDLSAALMENPILRLGLRGQSLDTYVEKQPNSWKAENFVADLALERFRSTRELSKSIAVAVQSPEGYIEEIKELVSQIDESNKETLAEYVVHRRRVLELLDATRRFSGDGSRSPEDTIHDLIFKRFSDSTDINYFEHNLWVIDDTLAFVPYVSSDRSMQGKGRKKGDKIPDLVFFDDSLVLGAPDATSLAIVEFKKPSRDDYHFGDVKRDPILQVLETLEKAMQQGGITKNSGEHVDFTQAVRRFAYVIADITPSLFAVLRRHDFRNDFNPDIWYRYRENEGVLIQAFGFKTLIENAQKRNQAFFSVLFGE